MQMRRPLLIIAIASTVLSIVFFWFLALAVTDLPDRATSYFSCGYCRASMRSETYFGIKLPGKVKNNQFSCYYLKHVDPLHAHTWLQGGSISHYLFRGTEVGCCNWHGMLPWDLNLDTAEAVCRSLPNPASRKKFISSIYLPEPKMSERNFKRYRKLAPAINMLNKAYQSNPKRKDWIRLLHQFELYPKVKK